MKKSLIAATAACLACFAGSATISAQEGGMLVIPVEMFTCTYNNRQDEADLDRVIDRWNAWADKNNVNTYAAWTLTPYYSGPEQEFDVIWLGAGTNAVELGKAQDLYLTNNDGLDEAFEEVLTCDAHVNFASINFKAPPEGETPANSILTFSDCTYEEGATFEALGNAMAEWSKHLADAGSTTGIWHWYPAYGGGGEEFDFKWLQAYANLEELGGDYERYGNGRGFETRGRLLGHLVECDSSRAYVAQSRRYVQLR